MIQTHTFQDPAMQLRAEWANAVAFALGEAHPDDAAAICAAFLDTVTAGNPPFPIFGDLRADAAFWADCAHVAELEIYFCAILNRLPKLALGIAARKRLFKALWISFTDTDRAAFLRHVKGGKA